MTRVIEVPALAQQVIAGRRRRRRRWTIGVAVLAAAFVLAVAASLMIGNTFYSPVEVARVIFGEQVPGASFAVGHLRLPRVTLAVLAGLAFGMAGVTFQVMLRNPLASPDIIGISSGASAFAVFAIVVLGSSGMITSAFALAGALITATAIALLSHRRGLSSARLILIGIGVAAMLNSAVTAILSRAPSWDLPAAMRWITGSLNDADAARIVPLALAVLILAPILLASTASLDAIRLGDDTAASLGVRVTPVRVLVILTAVALVAFATAGAGPIAFVAFLSGPIAARIVGPGRSPLIPAALVGALLVVLGDFIGQHGFGDRYPVGVVTGIIGAPYLILLLIRINRSGAGL